jgi:hypothetical protein
MLDGDWEFWIYARDLVHCLKFGGFALLLRQVQSVLLDVSLEQ